MLLETDQNSKFHNIQNSMKTDVIKYKLNKLEPFSSSNFQFI